LGKWQLFFIWRAPLGAGKTKPAQSLLKAYSKPTQSLLKAYSKLTQSLLKATDTYINGRALTGGYGTTMFRWRYKKSGYESRFFIIEGR
jgi:hypothetical protein